jgi:hypothetical protein
MRSFIICTHPQISLDISNQGEMRWAELMALVGEERKLYKVLAGKREGKRPLERPRSRWTDGIRMNFRVGAGGVDGI